MTADVMVFLRLELDAATGAVNVCGPAPSASALTALDRPYELVIWLGPGLGRCHGYPVLARVLPYLARSPRVHVAAENDRGRADLAETLRRGMGLTVSTSCAGFADST